MKNEKRSLIVLAILFLAFTVVSFVVPFTKNSVSWLSYIFAVISMAAQGYAAYVGFVKGGAARSKLYGFPVARIGFVYMIVQLVLSLVFMALAAIIPTRVVIIVCVLALAAAAIGFITTEAMREEIERQDAQIKKDVSLMRSLQSKMRSIAAENTDAVLAPELKSLSEKLQYSDPVSSEKIADIEEALVSLIDELQKAVFDGNWETAMTLCKRANTTLTERNRLCKLTKA